VLAIFALLFRGASVIEIVATATFLLIALGAALLTWFVGRRRPHAGSLAFFCIMSIAAIWITQQRGVNTTLAQASGMMETIEQRFTAQLGLKHRAQRGTQHTAVPGQ
jgi:hypothetical protein